MYLLLHLACYIPSTKTAEQLHTLWRFQACGPNNQLNPENPKIHAHKTLGFVSKAGWPSTPENFISSALIV